MLNLIGIKGPNWLADSGGLLHNVLALFGANSAPSWAQYVVFNLSLWEWLSGPSVAMTVIIILVVWTTSGTFMLLFIAALQNIGEEIDEASELDGASPWQRFRYVTLPMLRPTMLLVLTLGLIGI